MSLIYFEIYSSLSSIENCLSPSLFLTKEDRMNNVQYIYEMFSGCIDPQIIEDVVYALNGDTNKAVEQLLEFGSSGNLPKGGYAQHNLQRFPYHPPRMAGHIPPSIYLSDFLPKPFRSAYPLPSTQFANYLPPVHQIPPRFPNNFYQNSLGYRINASQSFTGLSPIAKPGTVIDNKNNSQKNEDSSCSTVMSQKDATALIKQYITNSEKVLVLLRGCPGSGKSTLARQIRFNGVILSTDDYFSNSGIYNYSASNLSTAHDWNRQKAEQAMKQCKNPVIIDNTNTQIWEMLPYAALASKFGYRVEVIEPDVQWRLQPGLLVKKNIHGVKKDKIISMLSRYDNNVTGNSLLNMVGGKSKDSNTCKTGLGSSCSHQKQSPSTSDVINLAPPTNAPVDSDWPSMKYGNRSEESDCNNGATSSESSRGFETAVAVNAESTWDGECRTLGEWMNWGEDNKKTDFDDGMDLPSGCDEILPIEKESLDMKSNEEVHESSDVLKLSGEFKSNVTFNDCLESGSANANEQEEGDATIERSVDYDDCVDHSFEVSESSDVEKYDKELDLKGSSDKLEEVAKLSTLVEIGVGTDDDDFALIDLFEEQGYPATVDNFQTVLTPRKEFVAWINTSSSHNTPSKRPLRYGLDRSAQTCNDLMDDCQLLQLLENCFPDVDPDYIKRLYAEKRNEPNVLVDALTEFGKHRDDSPDISECDGDALQPSCDEDEVPSDSQVPEFEPPDDIDKDCDSSFEGLPPLNISPELGDQLMKLFGRPSNFKPSINGKGYMIEMSLELAHMIHQTWINGSTTSNPESNNDQIIKDGNETNVDGNLNELDSFPELMDLPVPNLVNSLSTKIKLKQLHEKFPHINKQILDNIFGASGYMLDIAVKTIEDSPQLVAHAEVSMTDEYAAELENNQLIKAIEASLEMYNKMSVVNRDGNMSLHQAYSDTVEKMKRSQSMYKEFIGKAKDAFSQRKFPQAHFYSMTAKNCKQKYFEERKLCSELLLKKMTECSLHTGSLDLHGLKVKEALDLISQIFSGHLNELSRKRPHLFVITGRGIHSAGGVAKIKPCIENYLKRNNILFTEATPGILKVNLGRR